MADMKEPSLAQLQMYENNSTTFQDWVNNNHLYLDYKEVKKNDNRTS